jgi:peptidoglycan/xylan/chitin deacetylase (PgdA/CDA1 family)
MSSILRTRWYLKKAARHGMALGAGTCGRLAVGFARSAAAKIRVLTYHRLGDWKRDPFCVTEQNFRAQMRYLAENGLAVSLHDLQAFLAGSKKLADGSVLVAIDDGYRSLFTGMLPILKEFRIPAVAYVSPGLIRDSADGSKQNNAGGDMPEPYLTWDELKTLAENGVVIGSHGWSHRSLGRMEAAEVRQEAIQSRHVLQTRLGRTVDSFAYPYGTRADFNASTTAILAEACYTTVFTSQHGAITKGADAIALPRIKVEGGEGLWMFRRLCGGALDSWRLADRVLWRWQGDRGQGLGNRG